MGKIIKDRVLRPMAGNECFRHASGWGVNMPVYMGTVRRVAKSVRYAPSGGGPVAIPALVFEGTPVTWVYGMGEWEKRDRDAVRASWAMSMANPGQGDPPWLAPCPTRWPGVVLGEIGKK
jgi:hypothetical protein